MPYFNSDIPELLGSDTATCLTNLDILGRRQNKLWESILAMMAELSDAIVRDAGGDPDTVDSILLSLRWTGEDGGGDFTLAADDVAPVNRVPLSALFRRVGVCARLLLYRFIEERLPQRESTRPLSPNPLPPTVQGRIAYMPGAFADTAYLRLATVIPRPRAAAFHSFVEACEEVHGGLCEYAILPVENEQSGKLTAFARLILRYNLAIVAVCDLPNGAADGQITRFALVRQAPDSDMTAASLRGGTTADASSGGYARAQASSAPGATPSCLELLHTMSEPSVTELLTAAEFCGLTLLRADTLPRGEVYSETSGREGGSEAPPVCCVWNTAGADLATFRRYLSLEASEDIPMGLYTVIY